ncbi:MAG: rubredoxin [Candidatus Methanogranum gryphiswaldense]|nr:MAG: rubredoxin [Candidatus Methanogranum sp. U3.2.1]
MKYICSFCGHIYDDDKEEVSFDQLPDDWTCPMCGVPKSAFLPYRTLC